MCEACKKTFYITTPIYYPSDKLHIGHTYCTVATDAMARYKRLQGYDVMFLTGTDEHGQKIEDKAKAAGVTPQQFVDNIVAGPKGVLDLWKLMNISNDRFIRTTDDYHVESIQKIFKQDVRERRHLQGQVQGQVLHALRELLDREPARRTASAPTAAARSRTRRRRPISSASPSTPTASATCWTNTDFLEPRVPGQRDGQQLHRARAWRTCASPAPASPGACPWTLTRATWSTCGSTPCSTTPPPWASMNDKYHDYDKYWPADVHFVGKEIVRFHSIIWPAMLMSMGMPLPKKVYGHGWLAAWTAARCPSPRATWSTPICWPRRFGVDALRFFLLRTFPFGSDGNFSNELLINTHQH